MKSVAETTSKQPGKTSMAWIQNTILVFCSLVFALVLAEAIARVFAVSQRGESFVFWVPDNAAGYDVAPNVKPFPTKVGPEYSYSMFSNELGIMDRPYVGEKDYVLLLGDSFTHAWGEFSTLWGSQLETLLGQRVVKAGVTGYGTRQELLKAKKVISQIGAPPRLMIVGYYTNDLVDDWLFPNRTVVDGGLADRNLLVNYDTLERLTRSDQDLKKLQDSYAAARSPWTLSRSYLLDLVRSLPQAVETEVPLSLDFVFLSENLTEQRKAAWALHRRNIAEFGAFARQIGVPLLFVMIPNKVQVYPALLQGKVTAKDFDLMRANLTLHDTFDMDAIGYLDLVEPFQMHRRTNGNGMPADGGDLYWRIDGHWNPQGHRLAALLTAERLLSSGLLAQPDANARLARIRSELASFNHP
jgi:hypothetical protein